MAAALQTRPFLVLLTGPLQGSRFDVPAGRSEIGREVGVAIRLDDENVSRRHAALEHRDEHVAIADLGSTNGTWINRQRVDGWRQLRDGDEVRLGPVLLRFCTVTAAPSGVTRPDAAEQDDRGNRSYTVGDVQGPVQTGSGQQYSSGRDQYVAGRDQYNDQSLRIDADYDPWDEIFRGKGVGRVLMAVGGLLALVGFGLWMYFIFTGFGTDFPGESSDLGNPFLERELVPGVPLAVAGFGLFLGGGVLAGVGGGMSKAARKREEQTRRERLHRDR